VFSLKVYFLKFIDFLALEFVRELIVFFSIGMNDRTLVNASLSGIIPDAIGNLNNLVTL